jgi:hypothetical protein
MNANRYQLCDFIYDPDMKGQSLAVLAILSQKEQSVVNPVWDNEFKKYKCTTKVWRFDNCREQGFILGYSNGYFGGDKNLYFAVSEHRNTDAIVVYHWSGDRWGNQRAGQINEQIVWENCKFFNYLDIKGAVDFILNEIRSINGH